MACASTRASLIGSAISFSSTGFVWPSAVQMASLSSSRLTGLTRQTRTPLFLALEILALLSSEVSSITVWSRWLKRFLISSIASKPSMTGILPSSRISLNVSPLCSPFSIVSRATAPFSDSLTCAPQPDNVSLNMRRLVTLSSTTRIRIPLISTASGLSVGCGCLSMQNSAVNEKVLPWPGSLSTQIFPPIISTNRLQMVNPSPVPPYSRVVDESAWVKLSNIWGCFSRGMPMPVSRTENNSSTVPISSSV